MRARDATTIETRVPRGGNVSISGAAGSPAPSRIHAVDVLRVFAAFQMVQGHTLSALLDPADAHGVIVEVWTRLRGLTSVAFLLAAGLAFHVSTVARFSAHRADPKARAKRFRRALLLLAIGYALHAPAAYFFGADEREARVALAAFFACDVLQCIGVTLAIAEALVVFLPRAWLVTTVAALLAIAFLAGAPFVETAMRTSDPPGVLVDVLRNYLTHERGSLFPLFPWSGVMLGGIALGAMTFPQGAATPRLRVVGTLAGMSIVLGYAIPRLLVLADAVPAWATPPARPADLLVKVGPVLGTLAVLAFAFPPERRMPRAISVIAAESLAIYVFHLLVLYLAGIGLVRIIGPTLSPTSAIVVALGLVVASFVFGYAWAHRRELLARKART